ncbi:MAG: prephenate dehydrogenase/arogenate dehydrogenase family protein [Patescibacteria group bacterium]
MNRKFDSPRPISNGVNIRSIGIVGYGAFGKLLHTLVGRFAPSAEVRVFSSREKPDGKTFFTLEETAQSDAVVLAVPIHAFEDALKNILPLVCKDTVIIDVATVKVHTTAILKRVAGEQPYIATHPMWGPESYEKRNGDVSGFRIVLAEHSLPNEVYTALAEFLKQCGFDVVEMTPEQHDKHLAETLFLTHFIGQIVAQGGFNRTEIDTVSFGYLMDAVESVKHDGKLFKDVYTFNPYCKEVLERFEISEGKVSKLLEK